MAKQLLVNSILLFGTSTARIIFSDDNYEVKEQKTVNDVKELPPNATLCPDNLDWCSDPEAYPESVILKAVSRQKKAVDILFDHQKNKENQQNISKPIETPG